MNYIILAQTIKLIPMNELYYSCPNNYSIHKHKFYAIQKKYENYISSNYEKLFKKTSSLISYTILVYLDIQK